jgi:murein DD-endopeptidase MepM/ murein hydrolase activator NlpD
VTRRAHLAWSVVFIVLGVCAVVGHLTAHPVRPDAIRGPVSSAIVAAEHSPSLLIPVVGVPRSELRDSFGAQRSGHRHAAIDIMAPRGTPAIAAVSGTVLKLDHSGAGGVTVYLVDDAGLTVYYYAHLDAYAPGLSESDRVAAGQLLGYVGTTGNAPPDRPHLHFGIEHLPPSREWWKGEAVDPYPILMARGDTVAR